MQMYRSELEAAVAKQAAQVDKPPEVHHLLPIILLGSVLFALLFTSTLLARREGLHAFSWWLPVVPQVLQSDPCQIAADNILRVANVKVPAPDDWILVGAWGPLIIGAAVAATSLSQGRRLIQFSVLVSTLYVGLAGADWLDSALIGRRQFKTTFGCITSAEEIFMLTHFNSYLRALVPLTLGSVVLVLLAGSEKPLALLPRERRVWWRWALVVLLWLGAVPAYLLIWVSAQDIPKEGSFVIHAVASLPLTVMIGGSVFALVPRPRLSQVGVAAVTAGIGLAVAGYASIWALDSAYDTVLSPTGPVSAFGPLQTFTRTSELSNDAQNRLDTFQSHFFFTAVVLIWVGALSFAIRWLLFQRKPSIDAQQRPLAEPAPV